MSFEEEEEIAILTTTQESRDLLKIPQDYTVVGKCYGCSDDITLFKEFIEWYNSNNNNSNSKKKYEDKFFPVIRTLSYYFKDDNNCLSKNNFYNKDQKSNMELSKMEVSPYLKCYGIFAFYTKFTFKNFNYDDMQKQIAEEVFDKKVDELGSLTFTTYTPSDVIFNQDLKIGIFKKNRNPVSTLDRDCYIQGKDAKTIYRQSQGRDYWRARAVREGVGSIGSTVFNFGSTVGSAVVKVGEKVGPHVEELLNDSSPPPSPTTNKDTMQGGKPLTKRHRKKRQNKKRKSRKSKK
jgi:hypothetical protein